MALNYNITDILNIDNANAGIDALSAETVDGTAYDAAFHFTGNFLSGNFIQDSADINSALSNLSISQDGLNAAHAFLIDSAAIDGTGSRTAYGNTASTQKALRVTTSTYTNVSVDNSPVAISTFVDVNGADAIPMIPQSGDLPTGDLVAANTDFGTGLMNAVSQALFKRLGKNAAINNDGTLRTDLMDKFYTALNDSVSESNVAYSSSKFLKRYVDSGRYADHTDKNVDQLKAYTVDDTMFKMIVKISGSVVDSSGGPNLSVSANSTRIFGTAGDDTLVEDGAYETHVFVALRHRDTV